MAIYGEFLAEEAREIAEETARVQAEVLAYQNAQNVARASEEVGGHLHHCTSLILTKLYRTTMMKPILPLPDSLPPMKTVPLWTRKP